jgi:hypothetical protein
VCRQSEDNACFGSGLFDVIGDLVATSTKGGEPTRAQIAHFTMPVHMSSAFTLTWCNSYTKRRPTQQFIDRGHLTVACATS